MSKAQKLVESRENAQAVIRFCSDSTSSLNKLFRERLGIEIARFERHHCLIGEQVSIDVIHKWHGIGRDAIPLEGVFHDIPIDFTVFKKCVINLVYRQTKTDERHYDRHTRTFALYAAEHASGYCDDDVINVISPYTEREKAPIVMCKAEMESVDYYERGVRVFGYLYKYVGDIGGIIDLTSSDKKRIDGFTVRLFKISDYTREDQIKPFSHLPEYFS